MSSIQILAALAHLGASLPAHLIKVASKVIAAVESGASAESVEALAIQVSTESGDLKVKVKGVDVVDDKAQAHFAAGIGRVAGAVYRALK